MKLSLELIPLQFELFALAPFLVQLLVQFFELVFVVALGAHHLLVAVPDRLGG